MFADLCAVTDRDTAWFLSMCAVGGLVIGFGSAYMTFLWVAARPAKVVAVVLPMSALMAAFVSMKVLPDPRTRGDICGYTPDVMFWPIYAFGFVPLAMIAGLFIGLRTFGKD